MGERASLMSAVLTSAIGILTTFLSMLIVDRIRRRKLFLIGHVRRIERSSFHVRRITEKTHTRLFLVKFCIGRDRETNARTW
ncbi:Sugar transport protein 3 [Linum grandiflorum]